MFNLSLKPPSPCYTPILYHNFYADYTGYLELHSENLNQKTFGFRQGPFVNSQKTYVIEKPCYVNHCVSESGNKMTILTYFNGDGMPIPMYAYLFAINADVAVKKS